jgi:hypothetical protein
MGWNRRTRPAIRPAIWPSSISSTFPPFKRPFLLPPVIWTTRTSPLLDSILGSICRHNEIMCRLVFKFTLNPVYYCI